MRLGSPATKVVRIMPVTPNCEAKIMLRGKPIAAVITLSFRLKLVLPCPLMKFPVLRLPKAVNR